MQATLGRSKGTVSWVGKVIRDEVEKARWGSDWKETFSYVKEHGLFPSYNSTLLA